MQQMQLNMQREMQRENREFQKEVREESHKLLASVPDLIAKTVTQFGLAYNIQPLMTIEGAPPSDTPLLLGASHSSRPSPTSDASLPSEKVPSVSGGPASVASQPSLSEAESDIQVTPAPSLPAPGDRIIQRSPSVRHAMTVDIPDPEALLNETIDDEMVNKGDEMIDSEATKVH